MFIFIAHGPGSANTVEPLIRVIPKHLVRLLPMHEAVAKIWGVDTVYHSYEGMTFPPGCVFVYGTGSCNALELDVPKLAKNFNGVSVSILDIFWAGESNLRRRYGSSPPDYLITPNQKSRDQAIEWGILPENRVFALGNPHFDRLIKYHGPPHDDSKPVDVGFYSQCSTSGDYSDTAHACKNALISLIKYRDANPHKVNRILVCPHPREDVTWLREMARKHGLHWRPEGVNSFDCLLRLDVALGVSSTVLYEGAMIGKAAVFYGNRDDFNMKMNNLRTMKFSAGITFDSTQRVLSFLRKLSEQSSRVQVTAV